MTLEPGTKLGNYELIGKIGAGGMGAVYKAYQPTLGRYVAIKVLPPQTAGDPTFAERFAQEAKAIGKLRHPNIVTAFDFAHEGDVAFLVSEFIDGGTLADQLGTPLPLDYTLQVIGPIASALDYAHARGVVHRDIKPQNVLLSHEGVPVLTDFGLAKIVGPGSGMTQAGSLMGTAEYIAPECAGGEPASPAADQYALGLIAYQMLVGRHPFPSDNPLSALMAHVHKPVPIPSTLGVALPPGAEAALLRILAKRPEERFARCGDFVKALSGSAFAIGTMPAAAPGLAPVAWPSTSPSQPPSAPPVAPATSPSESPFLSPAALVSPIERPPSIPPASIPPPIATAAAGVAAGATAIVAPPRVLPKTPPWWRRRRMLVLLAILIVLTIFALSTQEGRFAGVSGNAPARSQRRESASPQPSTAAPSASAALTPAPTSAASPASSPLQTVPVVATATPLRTPSLTVGPTTTPPAATTDDHGNTPQTATPLTAGQFTGGTIDPASDVDWFRFSVATAGQVLVELKGKTLASGAVALFVGNTTGGVTQVGTEDVDNGSGASVLATAREPGTYFVRVRSARGDIGTYAVAYSLIGR